MHEMSTEDFELLRKALQGQIVTYPSPECLGEFPGVVGGLRMLLDRCQVPDDSRLVFYAQGADGSYRRVFGRAVFNRTFGTLCFVEGE